MPGNAAPSPTRRQEDASNLNTADSAFESDACYQRGRRVSPGSYTDGRLVWVSGPGSRSAPLSHRKGISRRYALAGAPAAATGGGERGLPRAGLQLSPRCPVTGRGAAGAPTQAEAGWQPNNHKFTPDPAIFTSCRLTSDLEISDLE